MEMESKTLSDDLGPPKHRVGILYDERMCKHAAPNGEYHPENPYRVRSIWNKLQSSGITERCVVLSAKAAEDKNIALVHTRNLINLIKNISSKRFDSQRNEVAAKFNSIYFNEGSSEAAHLAAGSVIEVAEKVAKGKLDSAFAIVRPPGHHAEENKPMGFCLFNNVAIAASYLLNKRDLGIKKILIVDWDVHHGNGTQKTFWKDSRVLCFSVHRHEFGCFYPCGDNGSYAMIGEGPGAGYNINVPWENCGCGDADYIAAWDHILIPVAKEFDPDMIIISAGFDSANNDPLGGCCLSPYGYSVLLSKLMDFAGGKILMVLEGGYNLDSIANSALACVQVLLNEKPISGSCDDYPFESTWRVIQEVREKLGAFWPVLSETLLEEVTSKGSPLTLIPSCDPESEDDNGPLEAVSENLEAAIESVIQPLEEVNVNDDHGDALNVSNTWRQELSKIDIWYATFGSNMSKSRFLCYIEGGQVEGMRRSCVGSMDKIPPKDNLWRTFPHRLFFGRERTATWGPGGVAFLRPESNDQDKAYLCMYKITLEQFNDVLLQENLSSIDTDVALFDASDLQSIESKKCISLEAIKGGWYHNVLYLGKENDIPILTMSCTAADAESFKSGKFPIRAPCKEYAATLIKGLVEGMQLSLEEATAYIEAASTKPL